MSFGRTVLAAFIGGLLAIVFVLAWRASKETGKSIPASLTDVPGEAQRLASDVKARATSTAEDVKSRATAAAEDVKSRATATADGVKSRTSQTAETISARLDAIREREASLKERIAGLRSADDDGAAEIAEAAEQL